MTPKAEYWTLTNEQFKEIKTQINELGEKLLETLQQNGFTKIKSSNDWLGFTVEKSQGEILTFVGFSLYVESPQQFQLVLRKWNIKNPSETSVDLYEKKFAKIEEFESSFNEELMIIKNLFNNI